MNIGLFSPEISVAFTLAPKIVYSPMALSPAFASKICARVVPGRVQSAADAAKLEKLHVYNGVSGSFGCSF
jgi:hypothetical protein